MKKEMLGTYMVTTLESVRGSYDEIEVAHFGSYEEMIKLVKSHSPEWLNRFCKVGEDVDRTKLKFKKHE
jgi:hypothetical protein